MLTGSARSRCILGLVRANAHEIALAKDLTKIIQINDDDPLEHIIALIHELDLKAKALAGVRPGAHLILQLNEAWATLMLLLSSARPALTSSPWRRSC